ncbi:MAG: BatD family protein [Candidatus Omnitrophota bacterium]
MRKFLMAIIGSCVLFSCAFAENISVVSTVSSNRISLGTGLTLTITVTGAQGVTPPQIQPIDGFDVRYTGPSTRVSVINGAYSVEQDFNYAFLPLKEGKFTIPSFALDVKGQSFSTQPIPVEITSAPAASSAAPDPNATLQQDLESRMKLLVAVPKSQVYLGEAIPVTVRLYVNQLSLQELSFPEVVQDGFQIDPFPEPRQMNEVMDGVNWHVVEFMTHVYPTRCGEITVAPVVVRGNLVFKMNDRKDPAGGFFDDGFFSNFFTSYQKRPITISSRPFKLNVAPLPDQEHPADFSGAVGQYDFTMEASPLKIKEGDPITLKLAVTGEGNFKAVKAPEFKAEGFKVYDPVIKDESKRKMIEQVVIPTSIKQAQIPAMNFTYFDVTANAYKTITRGPIPIEVSPLATSEEFQAVAFAPVTSMPETLGRDILFIKESPGKFERKQGFVRRHLAFYISLVVYLQLWAGLLVFFLYHHRLRNDPVFASQRIAARQAFQSFDLAKGPLQEGDAKTFYNLLTKTLNDYFIQRTGLVPGKTDTHLIDAALRQMKVDEKHIVMIEDIYSSAEQACFAGLPVTSSVMRRHLADAEDIIRAVERRVR